MPGVDGIRVHLKDTGQILAGSTRDAYPCGFNGLFWLVEGRQPLCHLHTQRLVSAVGSVLEAAVQDVGLRQYGIDSSFDLGCGE